MNRALSIYANKASANVQDVLVDTNELVDDGILAKPFKEQFMEVKGIVDRLADITDEFTEVPPSEAHQEEMFRLMRKYNMGMSKLKQYDPDVIDGEDVGFDYNNPDQLVELLGLSADQELVLTTSLYNDLKERIAKIHDIPVAQIELRMVHVKDVSVNYDYLTELIEGLMNAIHSQNMNMASDYKEKIKDFAMGLEDRRYANQINKAADAIMNGTYPPEGHTIEYPVRLNSSLDIICEANTILAKDEIFNFRLKWGIVDVITNEELYELFERHTVGKQDLDNMGRITKLKRESIGEYRLKSTNQEIIKLNRIDYGLSLVDALYKLADMYVSER